VLARLKAFGFGADSIHSGKQAGSDVFSRLVRAQVSRDASLDIHDSHRSPGYNCSALVRHGSRNAALRTLRKHWYRQKRRSNSCGDQPVFRCSTGHGHYPHKVISMQRDTTCVLSCFTVLSWLTATQSELACAQRLVDAKTGPSRIAIPTFISDPRCPGIFKVRKVYHHCPPMSIYVSWVRSQSLSPDR
jgi:hypothetical protein